MKRKSVVIHTYNGAAKIRGALTALQQQKDSRSYEVIVVIDGSTDHTLEVVNTFRTFFPFLKPVTTPNQGRARARNEGVHHATRSLLVFLDDDVRLAPDAIEKHWDFHNKKANSILFGFLEMDPAHSSKDDFWNYRRTVEAQWRIDHDLEISFQNYAITTANMSMPLSVFNELGGFDPSLRDSEDFDFGVRALIKGIGVHYEPAIRGFHDDFSDIGQYIRRHREYITSKFELVERRPEYVELLPSQFIWMKGLPGDQLRKRIFGSAAIWQAIFKSRLFLLMPIAVRHKLYSAFIYVHSVLFLRKTN